jgi:hypothetical protein
MILLGPVLLRAQFRFKAKLNPQLVPVESLPPDVRQFMALRVKSIAERGEHDDEYGELHGAVQQFADPGMGGRIRCQIRDKNGRLHRIHYSMLERRSS